MASAENRRVSLEATLAFVTADADSNFSSDFSEEEEESSEEEIEVDNEEYSTNSKRCRIRGGLCRRIRARGGHNGVNNFRRDNLENRWKTEDKDPIIPAFSGEPGTKIDFPDSCNELDIFKCFIIDELIHHITKVTNKYAAQYIAANPTMGPHALARSWKDVTAIEIKKVFTLCLLMGVVQKLQLHLYWSQDPLLKASIFSVVMPRNRFQAITLRSRINGGGGLISRGVGNLCKI